MKRQDNTNVIDGEAIYVGLDLHNRQWHVTLRTSDRELFYGSIPGNWPSLKGLLDRHTARPLTVVYEAGYFGFWLHDLLVEYGAECTSLPFR